MARSSLDLEILQIMKLIANLTVQPADRLHRHFQQLLSRCVQVLRPLASSAQSVALVVVLLFLSLFLSPAKAAYAQGAMPTPQQVVEYALTLEKLEADFYRKAIDATRGGGLASLPQPAKDAITSYGEDEAQHVADLSAVLNSLGGNPDAVTIPANPNYTAILGRNPFANPADFLLALQYVEDLGVAAYKGQVNNLRAAGADTILAGALEIHTVEARHAAGIRYLRQTFFNADIRPWIRSPQEVIYQEVRPDSPIPFASEAFDGYATMDEVLALVKPVLTP
jgi:hypothetical protein